MSAITAEPTPDGTATPPTATPPAPEATQDWRAGLTGEYEPLRSEKALESFKGKDWTEVGPVLAKSFVETKKLVGARTDGMLKVPGKDAKPEEIAAYRKALGVPEGPDKYDWSAIKGLPVDEQKMAQITPVFHDIGLTNDQATRLAARFYEIEQHWKEQEREGYYQAHDKLADEWGKLVYDTRLQKVQRLVKKFADADTVEWMNRSGADVHPGLFKMLLPIAEQFSEDGFIDGGEAGSGGATLMEVSAKIDDLRTKMRSMERGSPEYKTLLDQLYDLNAQEAYLLGKK